MQERKQRIKLGFGGENSQRKKSQRRIDQYWNRIAWSRCFTRLSSSLLMTYSFYAPLRSGMESYPSHWGVQSHLLSISTSCSWAWTKLRNCVKNTWPISRRIPSSRSWLSPLWTSGRKWTPCSIRSTSGRMTPNGRKTAQRWRRKKSSKWSGWWGAWSRVSWPKRAKQGA